MSVRDYAFTAIDRGVVRFDDSLGHDRHGRMCWRSDQGSPSALRQLDTKETRAVAIELEAMVATLRAELQLAQDALKVATRAPGRTIAAENDREQQRERAETAERELARANALLRRLEWALDGGDYCPICQMAEPHHAGDCELDRHLRGDAPAQPATRQPASPSVVRAHIATVVADGMVLEGIALGWRAAEQHHGITGEPAVEAAPRHDGDEEK